MLIYSPYQNSEFINFKRNPLNHILFDRDSFLGRLSRQGVQDGIGDVFANAKAICEVST